MILNTPCLKEQTYFNNGIGGDDGLRWYVRLSEDNQIIPTKSKQSISESVWSFIW